MGRWVYPLVVRVFQVAFALLGVRLHVTGEQNVPHSGGAVLAINHTSFLDFALAGEPARRRRRLVRFLAKRSAFTNPVSGPLMRVMNHIPVDRRFGAPAYRKARRAVAAGELIGVFPEATISRSWTLRTLKPGAAAVAVREQVPLIPVILWGGHRILTVDGHRSWRRGTPVTIVMGEALRPPPDADVEAVTQELRARMSAMLDDVQRAYPARPRDDADRWWLPSHLGGTALPKVGV